MDVVTLAMAKAYSDSKGGYTEQSRGELIFTIPEESAEDFPFTIMEEIGAGMLELENMKPPLVVGKKYEVILDGKLYVCEAKEFEGDAFIGILPNSEDISNPNPPFSFVIIGEGFQLVVFNDSTTHVIEIYEITETIHPIDKKYLPGVCLPVVELSTTFKNGASYTSEESDVLTEVFEKNTPVVVRSKIDLDTLGVFENTSIVWNSVLTSGIEVFIASFGGQILQITKMGDSPTWFCNVQ